MSAPHLHADRRASVRSTISVPVSYGNGEKWFEGKLIDVCASGLGLSGPHVVPADSELELRFGNVPGKGHLLAIRAVVRHAQGTRMGVELVNFGAGDHRKMLDTIQRLTAHIPAAK